MGISITSPDIESELFEMGCATVWANLQRAAFDQGCVFKALEVVERGGSAGALFVFAFKLNGHRTQITVHRDDIVAGTRLQRKINGAMNVVKELKPIPESL